MIPYSVAILDLKPSPSSPSLAVMSVFGVDRKVDWKKP
jgi:hypothetical protein